jgi:hypothetical protein
VERDPDGSIRVSVYDYRDPAGLQKRIEAFGVKAAVDYLPAGMTCQESRADFVPADRMPLAMVDWAPLGSADHYFKVHPQYIGAGQTFVYTVQLSKHSQRAAIRLANGPVAPCTPVPGNVVCRATAAERHSQVCGNETARLREAQPGRTHKAVPYSSAVAVVPRSAGTASGT